MKAFFMYACMIGGAPWAESMPAQPCWVTSCCYSDAELSSWKKPLFLLLWPKESILFLWARVGWFALMVWGPDEKWWKERSCFEEFCTCKCCWSLDTVVYDYWLGVSKFKVLFLHFIPTENMQKIKLIEVENIYFFKTENVSCQVYWVTSN